MVVVESQRNIPGQSTGRLHGLCVLIFLLASSDEDRKSCQESSFLESLKSEVLTGVDKDRRKREWNTEWQVKRKDIQKLSVVAHSWSAVFRSWRQEDSEFNASLGYRKRQKHHACHL